MFRYTLRGRERGEGDIITDEGEGNMDGVGKRIWDGVREGE